MYSPVLVGRYFCELSTSYVEAFSYNYNAASSVIEISDTSDTGTSENPTTTDDNSVSGAVSFSQTWPYGSAHGVLGGFFLQQHAVQHAMRHFTTQNTMRRMTMIPKPMISHDVQSIPVVSVALLLGERVGDSVGFLDTS
jgi:hypothetical protein